MTVETTLRQFCRLLMADRLYGDELTRIALESVAPGNCDDTAPDQVTAFRRLLDVWARTVDNSQNSAPLFSDAALLEGIGSPPNALQTAVLLSDVLGFDLNTINDIMAPTTNSVTELVISGRVIFASKAKGSVIVIEDEPVIASDLRLIIEELGAEVIDTATNAVAGVAAVLKHMPDAILVDYNLEGDKTGADLVNEIRDDHDCAVIFVTAFPDEALKGTENEPDIVIAKPYTEEGIRAAVAQSLSVPRPRIQYGE